MELNIKALDTLFFRDGKPFNAGEDNHANGIYPPYPSTLYGALNTWLAQGNPELQDELYENPQWQLKAIAYEYEKDEEVYFPAPLDLVAEDTEGIELEFLKMEDANPISSYPLPQQLKPQKQNKGGEYKKVKTPNALIKLSILQEYLENGFSESKLEGLNFSSFLKLEPKLGIALDKTSKGTREGMLYSIAMKRPLNHSIRVLLENIEKKYGVEEQKLTKLPFLKLGGENKAGSIKEIPKNTTSIKEILEEDYLEEVRLDGEKRELKFKIYLSTPAIFEAAWQPNLKKYGIEAELLTLATGKPLAVGGFDMKNRKPKPMLKAVPAGTVFYYKTEMEMDKLLEKFSKITSISEYYPEQGFGLFFIGNV